MAALPSGLPAINSYLKRGSGVSPFSFAIVPNVGDQSGMKMSAIKLDTTSHSTGVTWETDIGGLKSAGTIGFTLFYVPYSSAHAQLLDDFANSTIVPWQQVLANSGGVTWQCDGYVSKIDLGLPVKGLQTLAIEIQLTGDPILPTTGTV